jgi:hypothetical protein
MDTKKNNDVRKEENVPVMNRREALKKTGYAAFSAATMMLLLNKPDKALAQSPPQGMRESSPQSQPQSQPKKQRKY